jgi:Prokaryotic E2 family E
MRREFVLPEEDEEFLESLGVAWEAIREGGGQWLLLHDFPFPDGYNHAAGSIAIAIPSGYRTAQLDMAYFHPALIRLDGVPLKQTQVVQQIDGKAWQRWSRHYSWRADIDWLAIHVAHIKNWLAAGLQ